MKPRSQLFQQSTVSANVIISAIIMATKLASFKVGLAVTIHNFLYEGSLKKEVTLMLSWRHRSCIMSFFFEGGGHTEDLPTSSDELAKPFVKAWATILFVMVQESFKKCGIPNAIDGTDNNVLWFINVMTTYIKRE